LVCFVLIWFVVTARSTSAQELTPEERSRQYQQLAKDVAANEMVLGFVKRVAKLTSATVVHIEASKLERTQPRFGSRGRVEEAGSGVIVASSGKFYVLTNRHVIKFAAPEDIKITLYDGRELYPDKVWGDEATDIAVMRVNATDLVAARVGNSDKVEIGEFVVALGSPFGLSKSVTHGIISAKGRRDLELGDDGVRFQDFMQTDAAINPGNSGGPLMNLRGELIGINTAIASNSGGNEGIGFSIPINMVMIVGRQLIDNGKVTRAFLGVNLDSKFTPVIAARLGLPRPRGARITAITPGSPADASDLEVDDVVIQFGSVMVDDDDHLVNLVGLTEVGKQVPVMVFRNRAMMRLTVRVGDRSQLEKPR
jgi:serine protease Do